MIRRLSAVLIGLALTLPLLAMPVAANHGTSVVVNTTYSWYTAGDNVHVVGTVTNADDDRHANINVTATVLDSADATLGSDGAIAYVKFLAPHATSPFHVVVPVSTGTPDDVTVSVASSPTTTQPVGGLLVTVDAGDDATDGEISGTVKNMSSQTGTGIIVYGAASDGGVIEDTAASNTITTLAPLDTADWSINYAAAQVTLVDGAYYVAQTTTGTVVLTSWNNYFSDIGNSGFTADIAWLAEQSITFGCGPAKFCPKLSVTREQMAAFLSRALQLTDTETDYFTDDENSSLEQHINNVRAAGITLGCGTGATFCPTENVTREQMAAFLSRAFSLEETATDHFDDDDGRTLEDHINRFAEADITQGCGDRAFCPTQNVTREQMAAFLHRSESRIATYIATH